MTKNEIIEEGKAAYTWYMYYECADSSYNSEESGKWFSRLCDLRTKALDLGVDPKTFEE